MAHTSVRYGQNTRLRIIRAGTKMFLEQGFSNVTVAAIAMEVGISKGNLVFHFPTKEHLLAELVKELCDFQWEVLRKHEDEDKTPLLAYCLELTVMAAICESNPMAKDFYISAYSHPITLEIIRKNDVKKLQDTFSEFMPEWSEEEFVFAENVISGIEYGTLMSEVLDDKQNQKLWLDQRIAYGLNGIMKLFDVPKELRERKIKKVLSMDYREMGDNILWDFIEYADKVNEDAVKETVKWML